MINEKDISIEKEVLFKIQSAKLKEKFEKRRINFYPCESSNQALDIIKGIVTDAINTGGGYKTLAFSDSVTLHQINLYYMVEILSKELNFAINNPFERYPDGKLKAYGEQPPGKMNIPEKEYIELQKEWIEKLRSTLMSDILIIGANAITMKGQIVSTDGAGNRVAGMTFGPRKVIVVVGRNKLVNNLEQAIDRNRNIAAPLNYIRHNEKHHSRYNNPCLTIGYCNDCNHPRRAYLNTVIIDGAVEANRDRIHLVYINEDLGL